MATISTAIRASAGIRDLLKQDKYVNFFHGNFYTNTHAHPMPIDARSPPAPPQGPNCTWIIDKPHGSKHRLDPVAFSLWSDTKHDYLSITLQQVEEIAALYQSDDIQIITPFIIIATDSPSLPGDNGMITLTVGCRPAIFVSPQTAHEGFAPIVINRANGFRYINRRMSDPLVGVYQAIPWTSPSLFQAGSILEVLQSLCDVSALNFVWPHLIVEIGESGKDIANESLPCELGGWSVFYHQDTGGGKFWDSMRLGRKRNITPTQENFPKGDDTNYLQKDGIIGPGARVESPTMATTLGVRLRKGTEVRVTVASHGFAGNPRIFHPDGDTGDYIADITHRFPDNDWALARLHPSISFSNDRIFESSIPTRLMTREEMVNKRGWYECDGMTTGKIALFHSGVRYLRGVQDTAYVASIGRYTTASIYYALGASGDGDKDNLLRAGICGAPIVHEQSGGVGGFFQFQDQSNYCLASHLDKLIEEGWEIY